MEKDIERLLRKKCLEKGLLALKFVSPGYAGVPDRLVLIPGGRVAFVELKSPGRKPSTLQKKRLQMLAVMGFEVNIVDSKEKIEEFVEKHAE